MSLSSFLPALKTVIKFIIATEAFKALMAVLLDWPCVQIGKLGEWLIKKVQKHKKKYIDDEECFE